MSLCCESCFAYDGITRHTFSVILSPVFTRHCEMDAGCVELTYHMSIMLRSEGFATHTADLRNYKTESTEEGCSW